MHDYYIEIAKLDGTQRKSGRIAGINNIQNIISAFFRKGWMVQIYYEV